MEFNAKVVETSRPVSRKFEVMLKDYSSAQSLDQLTESGDVVDIKVDLFAIVHVQNPQSKQNPEYDVCVIIDQDGNRYRTGSDSCIRQLRDCMKDMEGVEEEWALRFYKRASKNYQGKSFITCTII